MRTRDKKRRLAARVMGLALVGLIGASSLLHAACDSDTVKEANPAPIGTTLPDGAPVATDSATDGPTLPDGAPSDCFMNPTTHLEIINACTDAVRITKNPALPRLLSDGGLPPL